VREYFTKANIVEKVRSGGISTGLCVIADNKTVPPILKTSTMGKSIEVADQQIPEIICDSLE